MVFGDNLRRNRWALATHAIAAACILATIWLADHADEAFSLFAFIPFNFSIHPAKAAYTLVTAVFLHAGLTHLAGNIVFLYAFGRSIESLVGKLLYLAAFVGLGAFSFLGSWLLDPASTRPIVGASGALSFLLGAYTIVFPRAKLRIIPFLRWPYLRAWFFALIWLLFQAADFLSLGEAASGVAYATHLAGFVIGLVTGVAWKEFALDTDRLIAELNEETRT
jgi:membrane associated rhomboid family serine protease